MNGSQNDVGPLHDHALAKMFVDQHQHEIRYVTGSKRPSWYVKNGAIWRQDSLRFVEYRVREFLNALNVDGDMRLGADRTIKAVVGQAGNDPRVTMHFDALNRQGHLLGTPGGIIDLKTGEAYQNDIDPLISMSTGIAPDFQASHPTWNQFLEQITMGQWRLVQFLQTWCGYCLTGETADHAMLILFGSGRNGKTTFIEVLRDILAEYTRVPDRNLFVANGRVAHFAATSHLIGSRLVAVPEIEKGAVWNESLLKAFTGGDTIDSKGMWAEQADYRPSAKLVVGTNHLPEPKAINKALVQRLQVLEILFSTHSPDTSLKSQLELEYPAIMAWMIDGAKRYYRRFDLGKKGIKIPKYVAEATADYFYQFDFFQQWWDLYIIEKEGEKAIGQDLRTSFNNFLIQNGEMHIGKEDFGKSMSGKGYRSRSDYVKGDQVRRHRGIKLRRKPRSS